MKKPLLQSFLNWANPPGGTAPGSGNAPSIPMPRNRKFGPGAFPTPAKGCWSRRIQPISRWV